LLLSTKENKIMKSTALVVGKEEIIHQVAADSGLSLQDATKVLEAFKGVVHGELTKGHSVRLMGFGTWEVRKVGARRVKSIRGGKEITIPARHRVGFSVGAVLGTAAENHKTS
jgi:DNA-binding protein HU-beta